MKLMYRLGLITAGCVFAGVVREATMRTLYWVGRPDALQGLVPYLIPLFFGYVYAMDARSHWSENRLKNDVMAYVGSTLLIGHPLLFSLSFLFSGADSDPASLRIKIASNVLLLANLAIAVLVWRAAVVRGFPLSMPWGGVSGNRRTEEAPQQEVPGEAPAQTPEQAPGIPVHEAESAPEPDAGKTPEQEAEKEQTAEKERAEGAPKDLPQTPQA